MYGILAMMTRPSKPRDSARSALLTILLDWRKEGLRKEGLRRDLGSGGGGRGGEGVVAEERRSGKVGPFIAFMGKICGSAGRNGHFCSMKLSHLGDCVFGLEGASESTHKRQRVSETVPQDSPNSPGEERPKAAKPSLPAVAEKPAPALKPAPAATKCKWAVKPKPAAKPMAAGAKRLGRVRVVCGSAGPLGWRIQGTSSGFCAKKLGHLGNCFDDDDGWPC